VPQQGLYHARHPLMAARYFRPLKQQTPARARSSRATGLSALGAAQ